MKTTALNNDIIEDVEDSPGLQTDVDGRYFRGCYGGWR